MKSGHYKASFCELFPRKVNKQNGKQSDTKRSNIFTCRHAPCPKVTACNTPEGEEGLATF